MMHCPTRRLPPYDLPNCAAMTATLGSPMRSPNHKGAAQEYKSAAQVCEGAARRTSPPGHKGTAQVGEGAARVCAAHRTAQTAPLRESARKQPNALCSAHPPMICCTAQPTALHRPPRQRCSPSLRGHSPSHMGAARDYESAARVCKGAAQCTSPPGHKGAAQVGEGAARVGKGAAQVCTAHRTVQPTALHRPTHCVSLQGSSPTHFAVLAPLRSAVLRSPLHCTDCHHEGAAQVCEGTARAIRALPESTRAQPKFARA
jgi:hypothetical protein